MRYKREKKDFKLYKDSLQLIKKMSDEEAGQYLKLALAFWEEEEISVSRIVEISFLPLAAQFERDWNAYKKQCDGGILGAPFGSKGGRPKKNPPGDIAPFEKPPINPSKPPETPDTDTDTDKDKIKGEARKTRAYFLAHKEEIKEKTKAMYPDRNVDKAMEVFISRTGAKDYKYKNYVLAFQNWVREDKFGEFVQKIEPKKRTMEDIYKDYAF